MKSALTCVLLVLCVHSSAQITYSAGGNTLQYRYLNLYGGDPSGRYHLYQPVNGGYISIQHKRLEFGLSASRFNVHRSLTNHERFEVEDRDITERYGSSIGLSVWADMPYAPWVKPGIGVYRITNFQSNSQMYPMIWVQTTTYALYPNLNLRLMKSHSVELILNAGVLIGKEKGTMHISRSIQPYNHFFVRGEVMTLKLGYRLSKENPG
ncbi:MAG: hypothetical protein H6608_12170 [Flavobacteriales bacterium]|nr:hypothetical protein [Bacteroidota bacterium]MCB9241886.1 hypothetical protein [Flavobacteriales bacterium]